MIRVRRHLGFSISVLAGVSMLQASHVNADSSQPSATTTVCSLAKTNTSCTFTLDRRYPVSPSTSIQMYSGQTLTVVVKNPWPFERYYLDRTTATLTQSTDAAANVLQGAFPDLPKLQVETAMFKASPSAKKADPCTDAQSIPDTSAHLTSDNFNDFAACFVQRGQNAIKIYNSLTPYVAPDTVTSSSSGAPDCGSGDTSSTDSQTNSTAQNVPSELDKERQALQTIQQCIETYRTNEANFSGKITELSAVIKPPTNPTSTTTSATDADEAILTKLSVLQKVADSNAADLLGYSQRIADFLVEIPAGMTVNSVTLTAPKDMKDAYGNMISRTVTYAVNVVNVLVTAQEAALQATQKTAVASIPLTFADEAGQFWSWYRLEPSAGILISTLPIRSFSAAPSYSAGAVSGYTVEQTILRPTVVPFAAANYRLSEDLGWTRWKSDVYWTFAVGVNPNTVSADIATGLSISWREVMISALLHYGHDTRLIDGFTNGKSLGTTFTGSVPTQTYWTPSFALGVSVRVPTLTGR